VLSEDIIGQIRAIEAREKTRDQSDLPNLQTETPVPVADKPLAPINVIDSAVADGHASIFFELTSKPST
jgi:hypothetical protein